MPHAKGIAAWPTVNGFDIVGPRGDESIHVLLARVTIAPSAKWDSLKAGDPVVLRKVPNRPELEGMAATVVEHLHQKERPWRVTTRKLPAERPRAPPQPAEALTVPAASLTFSWWAGREMWMVGVRLAPYIDSLERLPHSARSKLDTIVSGDEGAPMSLVLQLGKLLQGAGDVEGATPLYRDVLDARRAALGSSHLATLTAINCLGVVLHDQGDLASAGALYREALDVRREVLGGRHPQTLASLNNLGVLLQDLGNLEGAAALLREALETKKVTLGERHPETLGSIGNLADLLRELGAFDEAAATLADTAAIASEGVGPNHVLTLVTEAKGARIHMAKTGQCAPLAEVVERMGAALGAAHPQTRKYATAAKLGAAASEAEVQAAVTEAESRAASEAAHAQATQLMPTVPALELPTTPHVAAARPSSLLDDFDDFEFDDLETFR